MTVGPRTAGEIARSRRDAARLLAATCDILRPATGLTDDGYPQDGETTIGTAVPCRLVHGRQPPWEQRSSGQVRSTETYLLYLPYDTEIAATDVVAIDGRWFEVLGQVGEQTREIMKQVELAELG